jgi:hypothetical protein
MAVDAMDDSARSGQPHTDDELPPAVAATLATSVLAGLSVALLLPVTAATARMFFRDLSPAVLLLVAFGATVVIAVLTGRLLQPRFVHFFGSMMNRFPALGGRGRRRINTR